MEEISASTPVYAPDNTLAVVCLKEGIATASAAVACTALKTATALSLVKGTRLEVNSASNTNAYITVSGAYSVAKSSSFVNVCYLDGRPSPTLTLSP
jgi:hypothetical protein